MHEKLVMKLCTENNIETIRSALISLKLPIKQTVIKIPATMSRRLKIGFSPRALKGCGLTKQVKVGGAYKSIYTSKAHALYHL